MTATAAPRHAYRLIAPDGVEIAVQEWGNSTGDAILFIHGFSQCHLSWERQVTDPALGRYRLVTYDLRGHGGSAKPLDASYYRDGARWAGELATVLGALGDASVVLVGWSYAARVISDYLAVHGTRRLRGINFIGVKTKVAAEFGSASVGATQRGMASPDIAANVSATSDFLRACAEHWQPDDFCSHLAFNMVVPAEVRGALMDRAYDADAVFAAVDVPVLFSHGARDKVAPLAAGIYGASITPGAAITVFSGAGHAPFFEESTRFNRELDAFVQRCRMHYPTSKAKWG